MHTLVLWSNGERVRVDLPGTIPKSEVVSLVGTDATISGVAATRFNEREQYVGARLMVRSLDQVVVNARPDRHPVSVPITSISGLLRFAQRDRTDQLVHVLGVVTRTGADGSLHVQDETGGVMVWPRLDAPPPEVGQTLDVVGYEARNGLSPRIDDADLYSAAAPLTIPPRPVDGSILDIHHDGALVLVDTLLVGVSAHPDNTSTRLQLERQGVGFEALVPGGAEGLDPGMRVQLQGGLRLESQRNHVHVAPQLQ